MPSRAAASSSGSSGCGVLGDRSALAHGVWLRDSDIELLARTGTPSCTTAPRTCGSAPAIAPLRHSSRRASRVALGLDDMGIADDDDMLAEVRMAHVLQRVRGEARHPRLRAAEVFGLMWEGGARVLGAGGDRPARAGPARRRRRGRLRALQRALRGRRRRRLGAAARPRQGGARRQRGRRTAAS